MPRSEESVYIDRSPEDVWAFVSEPANLPIWNAAVVSAEADSEVQVGTRVSGQIKFLGKKFDYVNEMTELDAPKVMGYKSVEAPFPFVGRDTLEAEGQGTRFTATMESEGAGGFFGKLGDPITMKMYGRQVRSDLENLKEILESQ